MSGPFQIVLDMARKLSLDERIVLADARREFNEALAYYYRLRPLVARNFLLLVRRVGQDLAEYPEARPTIASGLHEHRLIGFGESIVYRIDDEGICVVACAHPGYGPGAEAVLRSKVPS